MTSPEVFALSTGDIPAITRVHIEAFPGQALTRLGPDLVERYYMWLLMGPHDVAAYGWRPDDRLRGFVVAGRFRRAVSGFVLDNRGRLARRVLTRPWLLANPLVRGRIAEVWRWMRRRNLPDVAVEPAQRPSFGILVIAVTPGAEGRGGGRALLEAAEMAAQARGCSQLHLTVEPDNERAIRFYEHAGWNREADPSGWTGRMGKDV